MRGARLQHHSTRRTTKWGAPERELKPTSGTDWDDEDAEARSREPNEAPGRVARILPAAQPNHRKKEAQKKKTRARALQRRKTEPLHRHHSHYAGDENCDSARRRVTRVPREFKIDHRINITRDFPFGARRRRIPPSRERAKK